MNGIGERGAAPKGEPQARQFINTWDQSASDAVSGGG